MNIPFVDLISQYRLIKEEVDAAIQEVLDNGLFIGGKHVQSFEDEFSQYLHAHFSIGLNSGTDALILGIRAMNYRKNDEIIVPVHTFIATALGVSENGLIPVFVDSNELDCGMDIDDLRRKITKKTRAIIITHLYGQPDDIDVIKQVIHDSGQSIDIIEDACQAHGALYKGKKVGTFGVFSAFSFYPGKNLGAYGDGGAIVTNDQALNAACRMLREYGQKKKYVHETMGVNSRLDEIQAAVLSVKLRHLDDWNKKRQQLASYYTCAIQRVLPFITCPVEVEGRQSVYHIYAVLTPKRDALQAYLARRGIQTNIHYPIPLHMQKAFAYRNYKKGDFPIAEKKSIHMLSLPMYPEMTTDAINVIVKAIKEFYDR